MACDSFDDRYRITLPCGWCKGDMTFLISPDAPMPNLWACGHCHRLNEIILRSFIPAGMTPGEMPLSEVSIHLEKTDDPQP